MELASSAAPPVEILLSVEITNQETLWKAARHFQTPIFKTDLKLFKNKVRRPAYR